MRVLIVHPAMAPYRIGLFNRLAVECDLHLSFLLDSVPYHQELDARTLAARLRNLTVHQVSSWTLAGRPIPVGADALIREVAPDVIVTTEFSAASIALALQVSGHVPRPGLVIWTAENASMLSQRRGLRNLALSWCANRANAIIVYSNEAREALIRRSKRTDSIFVCANHQDEETMRAALRSSEVRARRELEARGMLNQRMFLYVGRLAPEKRVDLLLQAFRPVAAERDDVMLAIVGTGIEERRLRDLAGRLGLAGRIMWLGHLEGEMLMVWYRSSGVLVLPSERETYGAVINEALIAGCRVICSSACGAASLISDEAQGRVYSTGNVAQLERALFEAAERMPSGAERLMSPLNSLCEGLLQQDVAGFLAAGEHAQMRARSRS